MNSLNKFSFDDDRNDEAERAAAALNDQDIADMFFRNRPPQMESTHVCHCMQPVVTMIRIRMITVIRTVSIVRSQRTESAGVSVPETKSKPFPGSVTGDTRIENPEFQKNPR